MLGYRIHLTHALRQNAILTTTTTASNAHSNPSLWMRRLAVVLEHSAHQQEQSAEMRLLLPLLRRRGQRLGHDCLSAAAASDERLPQFLRSSVRSQRL
jgi:hypothetical protein